MFQYYSTIKKAVALFTFIMLLLSALSAQCVKGYLYEEASQEPLVGATIRLGGTNTGTYSNAAGYFTLNTNEVQDSFARVQISYLGFQPLDTLLPTNCKSLYQLYLWSASSLLLPVAEIYSTRLDRGKSLSKISIPVEVLNSIPLLLGEADPLKALSLFPGVATGAEGTSGLYVRGGTPDQNLILFDAARVYNTSHLFGMLSPFNPKLLKNVDLYKDGYPARFGGRLSSVIDIVGLEGNKKTHKKDISLGLVSSSAALQGPLWKGRTSYLLGGRFANLGLINVFNKIGYDQGLRNDFQSYRFYDFNAKVHHSFRRSGELAISFYSGQDRWKIAERSSLNETKLGIDWGNTTFSAIYTKPILTTGFLTTSISRNKYRYTIGQAQFNSLSEQASTTMDNSSYLLESNVKLDVQLPLSAKVSSRFGTEAGIMGVQPRAIRFTGDEDFNSLFPISAADQVQQLNGFGELAYEHKKWQLQLGARFSSFRTKRSTNTFVEPRLEVNYFANKTSSWRLAYTEMNQPLHLLSTTSVGVPSDVWVAATDRVLPQNGQQLSFGYTHHFSKYVELASQLYYKSSSNLIDFRRGTNFFQPFEGNWEDLVQTQGKGKAYGGELLLRISDKRLSGWLSYTVSNSSVRFEGINEGRWYRQRYDRPHDLSLTAFYQLSKSWQLASNFIFQSGYMITLPEAAYLDASGQYPIFYYKDRNNLRTPNYSRLDISATRKWSPRKGTEKSISFGVYNALFKRNPYYIEAGTGGSYVNNPNTGTSELVSTNIRIIQKSFLNFIPYVTYSFSF